MCPAPLTNNGICLCPSSIAAQPWTELGVEQEMGEELELEAELVWGWRRNEGRAGLGPKQGAEWSCSWVWRGNEGGAGPGGGAGLGG